LGHGDEVAVAEALADLARLLAQRQPTRAVARLPDLAGAPPEQIANLDAVLLTLVQDALGARDPARAAHWLALVVQPGPEPEGRPRGVRRLAALQECLIGACSELVGFLVAAGERGGRRQADQIVGLERRRRGGGGQRQVRVRPGLLPVRRPAALEGNRR
jgi:hypothetical protein